MVADPTRTVPVELWARIFGVLQPLFRPGRQQQARHYESLLAHQSSFWQLPSVCKAFQATFFRNSELCSQICIGDYMLDKAELSLLAWLRTHSTSLTSLQILGSHTQTSQCLLALSDFECPLESASVMVASQAVINSLGFFTALTTCTLRGDSSELGSPNLDLTPLQMLGTLKSLGLEVGRFTNVNKVSHLTNLEVSEARITSSSNCDFCSSLVKLQLSIASISIHTRGLCACTVLQSLEMGLSCIIHSHDASMHMRTLNEGTLKRLFPADISCLTALTSLTLAFFSDFGSQVVCSGISTLTSLEALSLTAFGLFKLNQEVSALTRLTRLHLDAQEYSDCHGDGFIDISLNWTSLQALQELHVMSHFTCDESVLGLAELEQLDIEDFLGAALAAGYSLEFLAILAQQSAAKKLLAVGVHSS